MKGIIHALETAIRHEKKAELFRKIALQRVEDQLKTLESKSDKLAFIEGVFQGDLTDVEVNMRYNLSQRIEKHGK